MQTIRVRCPKCEWEPYKGCRWQCSDCKTVWDTFDTYGECPGCGRVYLETACLSRQGGCGEMSPHADWYILEETLHEEASLRSPFWFWKKDVRPPVSLTDQLWVERSMVYLSKLFDPGYFNTLRTILVDELEPGPELSGKERTAVNIFNCLVGIMDIDPQDVQLLFFTNQPEEVSTDIVPTGKVWSNRTGSLGWYIETELGEKEVWVNLDELDSHALLVAVISHELCHYKLLGEKRVKRNNELLTDLLSVAFGFGIFKSNSYFNFVQWQTYNGRGWQTRVIGYLPEPVIAYAMAWLAHYRQEDTTWRQYLNKTMIKYFEQGYNYIKLNSDKVKWE